jgi:hypothetical protein
MRGADCDLDHDEYPICPLEVKMNADSLLPTLNIPLDNFRKKIEKPLTLLQVKTVVRIIHSMVIPIF